MIRSSQRRSRCEAHLPVLFPVARPRRRVFRQDAWMRNPMGVRRFRTGRATLRPTLWAAFASLFTNPRRYSKAMVVPVPAPPDAGQPLTVRGQNVGAQSGGQIADDASLDVDRRPSNS